MSTGRGPKGRGFTLIEMTIVLVIVASLSVAALTPLGTRLEARDRKRTARALDMAVEALYGYAIVHGRLPCPDAFDDRDGREDRVDDLTCATSHGLLPHVDLATAGRDAWGHRLAYHLTTATPDEAGASFAGVDDGLCSPADSDLDLCERGVFEILTRGDDPRTVGSELKTLFVLAGEVPAVVVAHGRNGYGAWRDSRYHGVPATHRDEGNNADADRQFIARDHAFGSGVCADNNNEAVPLCGFDDQLRWLSTNVLAERLVRGGRLP